MGVTYTFLFMLLALHLRPGYCLSKYHGMLTNDELGSYSKKDQIKEYDIILPKIHDPSKMSKRSTDSTNHNEQHRVTFTAFEEEHHVVLEKNHWLLRPGLEVEYLQPDGSIRKEPVQTRNCHFFATSISHGGSKGALSTCSGLRGVLSLDDDMMFIEPLKEDHARRMKRNIDDTTHPHLIYKQAADVDDEDDVCTVGDLPVADNGGSTGTVILANETTYNGPYLGAKYIEIFYVVDKLVYDEHLGETESYATTILNIMSRRFADPSLDISIRFSVVRLLISTTTTITATNPSGGEESITPDAVADTTLPNFCTWQASLSVDDDTDPNDWDLALLFTGSVKTKEKHFRKRFISTNPRRWNSHKFCLFCIVRQICLLD
ncbi:A disintegrin and metalloproteinase with thrombospondin motifs 1-like [Strongylocentrotus purpuratus]|uniref:Peptidase M12B propeptide domain-containing protein n=1 Tax=Strongylocentrotus purpuratus TaxID=7668 RepID=A0A7M7NFT1_STRPU|nr:A disintegrin and metalloproteinase with thrombospondin motifs 1-like [Strongylocentrotus purpuratus]